MNSPEKNQSLTDQTPRFSYSLRTMLLWTVAIAVAISTPQWLGRNAIMAVFYGMLALTAWQLSRWLPIIVAGILAVLAAIAAAGMMTLIVD